MTLEWQFMGDDEWIFGEKVRGLVRVKLAEVYFDEERDDKRGGWIWFCWPNKVGYHSGDRNLCVRGIAASLNDAVANCEDAMGVK